MSAEQAKGFLDQATQSIQGGMFTQAIDLIDQAIALDPNNAEAYLLKGVAMAQTNQPDAATEAFQKAIMIQPTNPKAFFNLAVHQSRTGNKTSALDAAREALRLDPAHAGARELVGQLEQELGLARTADPMLKEDAPPVQAVQNPYANQNPYASQNPYTQQNAPYYREGYGPSAHSVAFVERMGATWTTIGWVLVGIWVLIFLISMITSGPQIIEAMQQAMRNPNAQPPMQQGNLFLQVLSWINTLAALIWMIIDIADRRGNWLWLVLFICCCCCAPIQAIYMAAGRKNA